MAVTAGGDDDSGAGLEPGREGCCAARIRDAGGIMPRRGGAPPVRSCATPSASGSRSTGAPPTGGPIALYVNVGGTAGEPGPIGRRAPPAERLRPGRPLRSVGGPRRDGQVRRTARPRSSRCSTSATWRFAGESRWAAKRREPAPDDQDSPKAVVEVGDRPAEHRAVRVGRRALEVGDRPGPREFQRAALLLPRPFLRRRRARRPLAPARRLVLLRFDRLALPSPGHESILAANPRGASRRPAFG